MICRNQEVNFSSFKVNYLTIITSFGSSYAETRFRAEFMEMHNLKPVTGIHDRRMSEAVGNIRVEYY